MQLNFIPIKTRTVQPPKDEIWDILDNLSIVDGDIIFITSKILAIHQSRCVPVSGADKKELIRQEATYYLPYESENGFHVNLTITNNILIPAAGIDESNANEHYILWPKNVDELCAEIRKYLMQKNHIKRLGVVSTDSHTTPLRWGVTGITTGLAGINSLEDIRGKSDIFGRTMKLTQVNKIDPLTAMATLISGEADERIPIVILRGYEDIEFCENASMENFNIPLEVDIYRPLLEVLQ